MILKCLSDVQVFYVLIIIGTFNVFIIKGIKMKLAEDNIKQDLAKCQRL